MTVFEYGFPGSEQTTWCIRVAGAEVTLCGRKVRATNGSPGYFPVVQPTDPQPRCSRCVDLVSRPEAEGR